MVAHGSESDFYRFPVTHENNAAVIRIRRRRLSVQLQEASIDGFTVLVQPADARRLQLGAPWLLLHDGSTLEVQAQWFFQAADGQVQIGLRRLRDLTRPPVIGGWIPNLFGGPRTPNYSGGSLVFSGGLLALFVILTLPGLGDALGTSKRIQNALTAIYHEVRGLAGG